MFQRVAGDRRGGVSQKVQIEQVFKWAAAQRAGFNLGEANVAERENTQAAEQCARQVARSKNNGSLARPRSRVFFRPARQQEESRVIFFVIADVPSQDAGSVDVGGDSAGNRGRVR